MHALTLADSSSLSADARRLHLYLRSFPMRWIVLSPTWLASELGLSQHELDEAIDQLQAAGLVHDGPNGTLLYLAPRTPPEPKGMSPAPALL